MTKNTERFSNRVENYVRYRPEYPLDSIDYLYSLTGFSKDSIIADIGSGTGILTRFLLEKGNRVIGVEPNNEMRKAAEKLLEEYQKFVSIDGSAEATGLPDASIDNIICAQAFHWFDKDACKKEFSRIIKPGGKVVLVWNNRIVEDDGFSSGYEELLGKYVSDYNDLCHKSIKEEEFKKFFYNGTYIKADFENLQLLDFEGLKGRFLSSSYTPLPGELNHDVLIDELQKLFEKYNVQGKVTFMYKTDVYTGEV